MKQFYYMMLLICLSTTYGYSQDDLVSFVQKSDTYYHSLLADTSIKNFSFLLTSDQYLNYIAAHGDSSYYYPIKVYWVPGITPKRTLYTLPELNDSLRSQTLSMAQALDNFFMGLVYQNLYENIIVSPMAGIPQSADAVFSTDTVRIAYSLDFGEKNDPLQIKHKYTRAGQLYLSEEIVGDKKNLKRYSFEGVQGKWLCFGWQEQQFDKGEVNQGVVSKIEYKKDGEHFLPSRMDVTFQYRDAKNNNEIGSGTRILFFKDFQYNENIQIVTQDADSSGTAEQ